MINLVYDQAKNIAAALGVGGVLVSAYATSGLPVPASQSFVEAKIGSVVSRIDGLTASTLELSRRNIIQEKARLRFELQANAGLMPKADPVRRVTLERRSAEIGDQIAQLDRDDEGLRTKIEKLKPGL